MIRLKINESQAEQHFHVVRHLIQNRIKNVLRGGITQKSRAVNINRYPALKNYLISLLDDVELNLLITAKPDVLILINNRLKNSNPNFFKSNRIENYVLRNIFISHCYNKKEFSKRDFIQGIQIDTCPYCNRNYIYCLDRKNSIKPQIDHFFPKSIYPFLAASFYNLIPSCQTCNGFGAKEEKDPEKEGLINPYLLESNSFRFTYKINSINFLNPFVDKTSVTVELKQQNLQGHLNVFKLDKLYNQHSDHVIELIIKSKIKYSECYRKQLVDAFPALTLNTNEIDRMILGNYSTENEIHKRPLAKLYQDIGKELGLIS